ncbi:MAG: DUF4388 domain-containing protein [Deltaproteobacteria bacterium]|jgi:hypothetical protein|nr:DUF4388 domain-containing protein [Deltaproteobacteria bacterium]
MSLVGNLEDLSLGDILQIISLSQKSGVLVLRGDQGSGRIVFDAGLVRAACLKAGPEDLHDLLVAGGFIDPEGFDAAAARAAERGVGLEEAITQEAGLAAERVEALIRESVEAAILEMFTWLRGEFSFDMRSDVEPDDPRLTLTSGLNAQYLAMEGMRIRDERMRESADRGAVKPPAVGTDPAPSPSVMCPEEALDETAASAVAPVSSADLLAEAVLDREQEAAGQAASASVATPTVAAAAASALSPSALPVVVIDPEVSVLEWVKGAVSEAYGRVHVFQQAEQGLARIRQYLVRGEKPLVLISPTVEVDPLSGIHGLADFVKRLKAQAPGILVFGLREDAGEGSPASPAPSVLDALLSRPGLRELRLELEGGEGDGAQSFASALARAINGCCDGGRPSAEGDGSRQPGLQEVRRVTARLREASTRGTILPVVLDFASELFARVAMLLVRGDTVAAVAGRGIPALAAGSEDAVAPLSASEFDAGWISTVISTRNPAQGAPRTSGDALLLSRLGLAEPATAFVGPIESGGEIIALLYCDAGESAGRLPDTNGLEVVLHHAGLALDRAALERALHESDPAGD